MRTTLRRAARGLLLGTLAAATGLGLSALASVSAPVRADGPSAGPNIIRPLVVPAPNNSNVIAPITPVSSAVTLDTGARAFSADATPARALAPVVVQGPAGAGQTASYLNATGPLNIVGALDFATCQGGPTHVSAVVFDEDGNGVAGAKVTGYVQYSDSGSSLNEFPMTAGDGFTDVMFNSGSPLGGYDVVITLHADGQAADGTPESADTSVHCWAPY